ncbi:MAG: sodium pump decarboxylase subunit gamma [Gammaproteobacteria bacterium]|nr:MAG: sodium pump decarboxylase subunit gamma [Gammaproteobacteria bacterium]
MDTIFEPAIVLMVAGMGFVFVFLTLLVGVTTLMSRIINRYFPDPAPRLAAGGNTQLPGEDPNLPVVIAAAVRKYRSRHKK